MSTKKQFEVQENETIAECLKRIADEGYTPTRRIEKPIFIEVKQGDLVSYEPVGRYIVFEAKKSK
ncbi:NETI motif-containing protein [Bacillus sp. DNRA2]|uniref:NETI motif-containing protein n=1 Tax=Bacillus sp. DNRA2 TaxID=2723053 RepID=UPI00145D1F3C|nr:NETI motif-containing protein [Bacillus sp. DNRA2]NMD69619.1 NETI motif-containing protein [Bacillus sp. DNRA2]